MATVEDGNHMYAYSHRQPMYKQDDNSVAFTKSEKYI